MTLGTWASLVDAGEVLVAAWGCMVGDMAASDCKAAVAMGMAVGMAGRVDLAVAAMEVGGGR